MLARWSSFPWDKPSDIENISEVPTSCPRQASQLHLSHSSWLQGPSPGCLSLRQSRASLSPFGQMETKAWHGVTCSGPVAAASLPVCAGPGTPTSVARNSASFTYNSWTSTGPSHRHGLAGQAFWFFAWSCRAQPGRKVFRNFQGPSCGWTENFQDSLDQGRAGLAPWGGRGGRLWQQGWRLSPWHLRSPGGFPVLLWFPKKAPVVTRASL